MVPAVAQGAAALATKYGPSVVSSAGTLLKKATGGKVNSLSDIPGYVGNSASRLKIAANALVRSGIAPDDIYPSDVTAKDQRLLALRQEAEGLANGLRAQFEAGSDHTLDSNSIPAIVISLKRTKAALEVYGSEERYFLVNPKGGIPAGEFALRRAIRTAL